MGILEPRQRKHQETQLVHRSASGKCGHSQDYRSRAKKQEEDTCAVAGDDILYGLG
jgi:hypothetical protein